MKIKFLVLFLCLFIQAFLASSQRRTELGIGKKLNWKVWLDTAAKWQTDTLYLPHEVNIENITPKPPTIGWDAVYDIGVSTQLPASVEELFSGGDASWTYHGVSWATSIMDVPQSWEDKVVRLYIGKQNTRIEIYVNEKLAGYDLIANTPYICDISQYLKIGEKNSIAFRITNPGGQRGWNDLPAVEWGDYRLPPQHDFGGIGGDVMLYVTDPVFIEDVFVKNLLPARENNIQVETTIQNKVEENVEGTLKVVILPKGGDEPVFTDSYPITLGDSDQTIISKKIQVPSASLWDVDDPNLYVCSVSFNANKYQDAYNQTFGFRIFEVKANEAGEENFYLNGKRFRHLSAVDWSFYVHHGLYPSDSMARKSIENVKKIGHNGINLHRSMGDPILMDYADEMGVIMLEEPGGFVESFKLYNERNLTPYLTFSGQVMRYRCLRMIKRDRNHPSVFGHILANERDKFDLLRKNIMHEMHQIDDSKLIVNQSGGVPGGPAGPIPHIRPYETKMRLDYMDDHTVYSFGRFVEDEFFLHQSAHDYIAKKGVAGTIDPKKHDNIIYWGEVRCYTGPDNWVALNNQGKALSEGRSGYNVMTHQPMAEKIEAYFAMNNLPETGSKNILSPSDVSRQAGRGLMYIDGRLGQIIMSNNSADGYAINGWTGGSSVLPTGSQKWMEWYSAILDEGRNIKGPAEDIRFWNRPLQIALFRKNGKYFNPGDTLQLAVHLINNGKLAAGDYQFQIKIKEGDGNYTSYEKSLPFKVLGGDTYAQPILDSLFIEAQPKWQAGYLTVEGALYKNNERLAYGMEQVLLKNRPSFQKDFKEINLEVYNWPAAQKALREAGIKLNAKSDNKVVLVGEILSDKAVETLLKKVSGGAIGIIKFDSVWADKLYELKILKTPVTQWDGEQTFFWNGNGWGYLDHFIGDQAIPAKSTIGTNSWEVPNDPIGFAPFESAYPQKAYGAWFARPDKLMILLGEIAYGEGKLLLSPSYPVDDEHAFNDLFFFNMIKLGGVE